MDVPGPTQEAALWCMRLRDGPLPEDLELEFDRWLDRDPASRTTFDALASLWDDMGARAETPEMLGLRADALAWLRRRNERWGTRPAFVTRRGVVAMAGLVAATLLGVVATTNPFGTRDTIVASGVGERRTVSLPDGSRISLDGDTRIAYHFSDTRRQLALLEGRAKFDVAKDSKRPFTVSSAGKTVIATGTSFSVERFKSQFHVILYEGRVTVMNDASEGRADLTTIATRAGASPQALVPGRELVARSGSTEARVVDADLDQTLSWETGLMDFHDEPLALAAERMNRYSRRKLVIGDKRAAQTIINGVFHAGDTEAFVSSLTDVYGIAAVPSGEGIVLRSGGA